MFVDEVPDRPHGAAADDEAGVAIAMGDPLAVVLPAGSGHGAERTGGPGEGHAMGEAGIGVVAFPEFARLQADVTVAGEDGRQGRGVADEAVGFRPGGAILRGGHAEHLLVTGRRMVEMDAVLVGIEAGQQRGQRRPAEAHGNIARRVAGRRAGQGVDMRGMHEIVAEKAEIPERLVVGHDHDDVGHDAAGARGVRSGPPPPGGGRQAEHGDGENEAGPWAGNAGRGRKLAGNHRGTERVAWASGRWPGESALIAEGGGVGDVPEAVAAASLVRESHPRVKSSVRLGAPGDGAVPGRR